MWYRTRRLSWKAELAIVLALAFAWAIFGSLRYLLASTGTTRNSRSVITDASLWHVILLELIIFSLLVPFLYARGWSSARLGIRPTLRGCLIGGLLALVASGIYFSLVTLVGSLWPEARHALAHEHIVRWNLSWTSVFVASLVNSFYEEIFACGYVVSVLTERRTRTARLAMAVAISTAIRVSYHLYQGVEALLAVVPVGLLFGAWFARTRQLWPLIMAHAIMDFVALATRAG